MFRRATLALAALVLTAPAFGAPPCLRLDTINSWTVPDDRTLIVQDYHNRKFKVSLMGPCTGLAYSETLAFKSVGGFSLSCLRSGDYVLRRQAPQRCTISAVEPFTAAPAREGNGDGAKNVY